MVYKVYLNETVRKKKKGMQIVWLHPRPTKLEFSRSQQCVFKKLSQ